jgi:hypothetical protein
MSSAPHLFLRGLTRPGLPYIGGVGKSLCGGVGSGPDGGGYRDGTPPLNGPASLELGMLLLLDTRGGNIGLLGSMADAGSGMLSLGSNPLMARPVLGIMSSVSSDKCWSDKGGGGDRSAIPVGIDMADMPADLGPCRAGGDCGCTTVMSLVGLISFRAVIGVCAVRGVGTVPVVPVEDVDGPDPIYHESDVLPSLFRDLGAGGAK